MEVDRTDNQRSLFAERVASYFSRKRRPPFEDDGPPRRTLAVIVCVIISGVLWLTFTMQETQEISLPLAVRVDNMPPDRMLADPLPQTVRVTVEGERIQLLRLLWDPRPVPINASSERVVIEEVIGPLGNVRVLGVNPSVIEPRLEQLMERRVPIQLRYNIDLDSSWDFLKPPSISPDSVWVTGARSLVENLDYWPTQVFAYEDLRDTLKARVSLSDSLGSLIQKRPEEVLLTAISGQFIGGVREIDVHPRGVPASAEQVVALDPPTIRVHYRVLFSQYEEAKIAPDFYAEVSYDQIRADRTGYVRPELKIPDNLEIRDVQMIPPTVGYFDVVPSQ